MVKAVKFPSRMGASSASVALHVRVGSNGDMAARSDHVRFTRIAAVVATRSPHAYLVSGIRDWSRESER